MFHLNDTFAAGDQRLHRLLEEHKAEPQGFVPQHEKAHVTWPVVGHRNGYPVCYLPGRP